MAEQWAFNPLVQGSTPWRPTRDCRAGVTAALFNPLRRWVQRVVDRRFNRARYDAEQTVAALAARLKEALDLDAVPDDLAGVVQQTLEPAHVAVVTIPQKLNSLGSERGLATPSPDGKGRETSRPPH